MSYTLGQAAKATGKAKPTIQAQIKKGRISATKNALGEYSIDPAELHRVYPPISQEDGKSDQFRPPPNAEKDAKINQLEAVLKAMEETLREVKSDRDWARNQADHWRLRCLALEPPKPEGGEIGAGPPRSCAEPAPPKAGWLKRILGR